MYRMHDFIKVATGKEPAEDSEMFCYEIGAPQALGINPLAETIDCFVFTLVTKGAFALRSNMGCEATLGVNNLHIHTPGFPVSVAGASDDFHALCLIVDEKLTFEAPFVRNMIRMVYLPISKHNEPKLALSDIQADYLEKLLLNIVGHIHANHRFRKESLRTLYSLFLLDLMDMAEHLPDRPRLSERTESIFIDFIRLVQDNFLEHHDINFYADKLCISPNYLSKIIRQTTGRTVIDYINQLLLMEAGHLLQSTDMPIADIAGHLHFSDQVSFTRFFSRMKGISPLKFRRK